jgi:hypothetical protein
MATKKPTNPKCVAQLCGYDDQGALVFTEVMPLLEYYEELHDVIDKKEFRVKWGIRRLSGQLYDSNRQLMQEFENEYSADGAIVHGRARHADGTTDEF